MKWLFLVNDASYLFEFLGKISYQMEKEKDQCLIIFNSKMAEYEKRKFFVETSDFISKIDWCKKNYDPEKKVFDGLSWREFYTVWERFGLYHYDYQKSMDAVNQLYQFLNFVFQEEKPDVVIGEPPAGLFGLVSYYFCQKNNIPFCGVAESRFPERIDIYNLEWTNSKYEKDFKETRKENFLPEEINFAQEFIKGFLSHKVIYSSYYIVKIRIGILEFLIHYWSRLKDFNRVFWQYISRRREFKDFDYESESILGRSLSAPFRTIKRNLKINLQENVFDKFNPKDKYFFFPLQYEPEASTLVLATYHSNQLATVKNTTIALPFGYKLYLKEHPGSIGTRSINFYREIKKIPNAVLLSSEESTPDIIANSQGIITMTSTVGMEAAMAGKPVYVLGNVFYSYHPLCQRINNFDDLEKRLKNDLNKNQDLSNLQEINMRFIISYLRNSALANILFASEKEDKNDYQQIFKNIKKQIINNDKPVA
jgi:hypothetical protein